MPNLTIQPKLNLSDVDTTANQGYVESLDNHTKKINKTQEQEKRKHKLFQFCNYFLQKYPNPALSLSHHIYSDRKKVIYYFVPKVACTNWKWMMHQFDEMKSSTQPMMEREKKHAIGFKHITNKLYEKKKHYYKFLFVRHPFERLISAYRNKLLQPYSDDHYLLNTLGKQIVRTYRENSTRTNNTCTFAEFVEFLINKAAKKGSNSFNEHWKPQSLLCDICYTRFDFIGKYETLVEDSRIILKDIKVANQYKFPESKTDFYKTRSSEIYQQYMRTTPRENIKKLYEIYKDDFDAFSYDLPNFS